MSIIDDGSRGFRVIVGRPLLELLDRYRIRTSAQPGVQRFRLGDAVDVAKDTHLHAWSTHLRGLQIGKVGAFSYSFSQLGVEDEVGRYCSIGGNVRIMGPQHEIKFVTSSEMLYRRDGLFEPAYAELGAGRGALPRRRPSHPIRIGHDVWIGQDVLLKRGITIGHGAVVGAAAVVTRDVAPYEIVAGVPARRIRSRFPPELVEALLASRWWRFAIPQLPDLPWTDPAALVPALAQAERDGQASPFETDLGAVRTIVAGLPPG